VKRCLQSKWEFEQTTRLNYIEKIYKYSYLLSADNVRFREYHNFFLLLLHYNSNPASAASVCGFYITNNNVHKSGLTPLSGEPARHSVSDLNNTQQATLYTLDCKAIELRYLQGYI